MSYGLFGSIVATPGDGDALADHLLSAANGLQDVDGCSLYLVNRDAENPDVVWVYEVWESAADHQASLQLPTTQEVIAAARPVIAEMGVRFVLTPAGGKGMPAA